MANVGPDVQRREAPAVSRRLVDVGAAGEQRRHVGGAAVPDGVDERRVMLEARHRALQVVAAVPLYRPLVADKQPR